MPFAMNDPNSAAPTRAEDGPGRRWISEWLPEIALLVVTTAAGFWAAGRWIDPCWDGGYAWSLADRLLHGERLYRDVYLQHTPLSLLLLAAGARLFGLTTRYILLANWIPAIAAAVLLLACARGLLSTLERLALVGAVLATSLFAAGPGHLVFPYYPGVVHALVLSIGALLLTKTREPPPATRALLAGAMAGLAFGCKQEIGVAALLALATFALTGARPIAWITRLLLGFAAVLVPVAAFVLTRAPVESLQRDNQFWPLAFWPSAANQYFYARVSGLAQPHWRAAVVFEAARVLAVIGILALGALGIARERGRSRWLRVLAFLAIVGSFLFWAGRAHFKHLPLLSLSMSAAFAVAVIGLAARSLPLRPFLVASGTFAGLAGARTAFSLGASGHYQGPAHFASALTSFVFLLILMPLLLLGESRAGQLLRTGIGILLLAVAWWQAALGIANLRYPQKVAFDTREGRVFIEPQQADLFAAVARNSSPGQRVVVIPEPYAIDALFQLRDASPLVYAIPGWLTVDRERRLIERFEAAPPDLVVLLERPLSEYGSEPFGVGYGLLLADWISRNYRTVDSLPAGKILRHR